MKPVELDISTYRPATEGEMSGRVAQYDWAQTPLGPRENWSHSLALAVDMVLAAGFPMCVRWGPQLVMIYNDHYRTILGDKHPRALGLPLRDTWPEIYSQLGPLNEAILQGTRRAYYADDQVWRVYRYGRFEEAHFSVSYSPIPDDQAPSGVGGVLTTVVETTDRVASEQALRRLTRSLESEVGQRIRERDRIWQVSPDLLGVSNFEGYFISINPAWSVLLGWTEREIKSMHVSELRHPDDAPQAEAGRRQLAGGATTVHMENRFRHKDGSWHWLHWTMTAESGLIYVIGRDTTEQKHAAETLRQNVQQFRILVDGVIDYAIYMLDKTGTVASWNTGAQRIKGYSADEIVGQHFSRFYTEEDRTAGVPYRALATAKSEGRYAAEGWRVRKDGSRFWAMVAIDAIRNDGGELIGFAKVTRDITERRDAQLALEQAQRQTAYAQKMEALGQLTGGVAHDFNNMLMVIGGQAQMLMRRLSEEKDLRSVRAIQIASDRGATLTRQLLAFSRRQTLNPAPTDLRKRFEEFRDILVTSAREDIRLAIQVVPDTWPVTVDVSELQLAVVNIVVNARDAMPKGGSIIITTRNINAARGAIPDDLSGDFVAITVADSGTGIPEDVLPRVFEPFFTTKQQERGTGLGLSQVYGFARQSGGTVGLESVVGRGTSVTLYLPRGFKEAVEQDKAADVVRQSAGETVLLVEDNAQVGDVTAEMIGSLGYRVISADGAATALAILKSGQNVDLVFSDVVLPGTWDGFMLAQRVKDVRPGVPVLLTTGYTAPSQAVEADHPILKKPYQLSSLAAALRGALVGRTAH